MKGQSEFARAYRIATGGCPTHGISLKCDEHYRAGAPGATYYCPRKDCDFVFYYKRTHEYWPILFELSHGVPEEADEWMLFCEANMAREKREWLTDEEEEERLFRMEEYAAFRIVKHTPYFKKDRK